MWEFYLSILRFICVLLESIKMRPVRAREEWHKPTIIFHLELTMF